MPNPAVSAAIQEDDGSTTKSGILYDWPELA